MNANVCYDFENYITLLSVYFMCDSLKNNSYKIVFTLNTLHDSWIYCSYMLRFLDIIFFNKMYIYQRLCYVLYLRVQLFTSMHLWDSMPKQYTRMSSPKLSQFLCWLAATDLMTVVFILTFDMPFLWAQDFDWVFLSKCLITFILLLCNYNVIPIKLNSYANILEVCSIRKR